MRPALAALALIGLSAPMALAQMDPHQHHQHHHHGQPAAPAPAGMESSGAHHSGHGAELGPAGSTYDLRWIDAMVQHHTGALRMSELVFNTGEPGVGALAQSIWREQAREIKAMGQWRRAWYPQAPVYPVALAAGGDPNSLAALQRMGPAQIEAMRMSGNPPSPSNRTTWFLEGMLHHHGGALQMAHNALQNSSNATIRRLAREIIVAQRREILELRRMLRHDGLNKPAYYQYDPLFAL